MSRSPSILRRVITTLAVAAPLAIAGCSDSKSSSPAPSPTPTTTTGTKTLSAAFTTTCNPCHSGGTASATNNNKALKKSALTAAQYSAKVRAGVSGTSMTAYTATTISDADLANDYAYWEQ